MTESSQQPAVATAGQGSVASLVLGILGLLTSPILIGLVLGAIAAYLGGRKDPVAGISRAGRILGILAIVLTLVFALLRGVAAANS